MDKIVVMRRVFQTFLLVFAFLFTQVGLAAHAVSHLVTSSHAGNDNGLPQDSACELCVGYADLSGSAPLPDKLSLPVCLARHESPRQPVSVFATGFLSPSPARAPPVFS